MTLAGKPKLDLLRAEETVAKLALRYPEVTGQEWRRPSGIRCQGQTFKMKAVIGLESWISTTRATREIAATIHGVAVALDFASVASGTAA